MPKTAKGEKIYKAMVEEYGKEKGEQVFYASKNKGTITGVDRPAISLDTIRASGRPRQRDARPSAAQKDAEFTYHGGGFVVGRGEHSSLAEAHKAALARGATYAQNAKTGENTNPKWQKDAGLSYEKETKPPVSDQLGAVAAYAGRSIGTTLGSTALRTGAEAAGGSTALGQAARVGSVMLSPTSATPTQSQASENAALGRPASAGAFSATPGPEIGPVQRDVRTLGSSEERRKVPSIFTTGISERDEAGLGSGGVGLDILKYEAGGGKRPTSGEGR